jgi:plasmid stabilization system protein ParE
MDASEASRQKRLIILSDLAGEDLAEIHVSTNHRWGWKQAERYIEFLKSEIAAVAEEPGSGRSVAGFEGVRLVLATWKGCSERALHLISSDRGRHLRRSSSA